MHNRKRLFLFLGVASASAAIAFVAWAVVRDRDRAEAAGPRGAVTIPEQAIVFRSLDRRRPETFGEVAFSPLDAPAASRTRTGLVCERVHYRGGTGICLAQKGAIEYEAILFDRRVRARHELGLVGFPSRARVSADGRFAAATTFVTGHSYAQPGQFSTRTILIDTASGEEIAELEDFQVTRDGETMDSPDFNFWGVTFAADPNRFYATLATGGKTYLVEGDVAARRLTVLHENVECPALSPDGTRVAYKKRVGEPAVWRFHVLDLATMAETPLAEDRVIDDQIEWLDDARVLYRVDEEVWTVAADGTGRPRRLIPAADSPAVVG
jgi:hypothetical protein